MLFHIVPVNSGSYQAGICLLKVNYRNTRTRCEICSKLAIKTPKRRYWHCSGVFIVNLTCVTPFPSVSLVNFEQIDAGWVEYC